MLCTDRFEARKINTQRRRTDGHSYIRMFDSLYKNSDDNPTIGIILCLQKMKL